VRRTTVRRLLWIGVGILLGGCASAASDTSPLSAEATLKDKDGKQVGYAVLVDTPEGVRIAVTGYRLPAGEHGLHIHEAGKCDPPDFVTAGGHFNPSGKQHGRLNPAGPHAGDLPNLKVAPSGEAGVEVTTRAVTLRPGPASLFGSKGSSLVVHASPDDEKTDPTGNSGARIACGVIVK
jgi:Cu-Zn family superoxide dismutase